MAKEIINNTERFILVQIDKEGTERVVYQDFKSEENAKKIAETLNLLYQLTNKKQRVKVVKEVVERSDLSPEVTVNTETV